MHYLYLLGCGKVGQIRCIFFAEFHPIKGPEIRCQAHTNPKDKVTKDIFEAISVFVIPKPQLDRTPLTVNVLDKKICGYPVMLKVRIMSFRQGIKWRI